MKNLRSKYNQQGYVIARKAIDPALAAETVQHVHWLCKRNPGVRPEHLHHHLLARDPFMHRLVGDERLADMAEQFLGPNIALFAAHYIAKPPGDGRAVQWHQDGSYWPLEPMEVTTLWVAGTASTIENGCMRVLPGTQNAHLHKRRELIDLDSEKYVLGVGIRPIRSTIQTRSISNSTQATSQSTIPISSTAPTPTHPTNGALASPCAIFQRPPG